MCMWKACGFIIRSCMGVDSSKINRSEQTDEPYYTPIPRGSTELSEKIIQSKG